MIVDRLNGGCCHCVKCHGNCLPTIKGEMPLFPSNLYLVDLDGLFQLLIYDIVGIKALNDIGQDLI